MSEQQSNRAADTAGVIAPPPLIALATLLAALGMDWLYPLSVLGRYFTWTVRLLLGGALLAAGGTLAVIAERTFRRIGTNVPPWQPTLALATGGIYRWLRNPMYVGSALMLAGIGIALGSEWMLILLIPAWLLLHYGVVLRE